MRRRGPFVGQLVRCALRGFLIALSCYSAHLQRVPRCTLMLNFMFICSDGKNAHVPLSAWSGSLACTTGATRFIYTAQIALLMHTTIVDFHESGYDHVARVDDRRYTDTVASTVTIIILHTKLIFVDSDATARRRINWRKLPAESLEWGS